MKTLDLSSLQPVPSLRESLFDPRTGTMLLAAGDPLTSEGIEALRMFNFHRLVAFAPSEDPSEFQRACQFDRLNILAIRPNRPLEYDLYTAQGTLIVSRGTVLSVDALQSLARRKIREVFIRRVHDSLHLSNLKRVAEVLLREKVKHTPASAGLDEKNLLPSTQGLSAGGVAKAIDLLQTSGGLRVQPNLRDALLHHIRPVDSTRARRQEIKADFQDIYQSLLAQTREIYQAITAKRMLQGRYIASLCSRSIAALIADRELLLGAIFLQPVEEDYLIRHSLNVSILAVNIAAAHGYSTPMVTEVGFGALLADVGMLDIPPEIRHKTEALTMKETMEIRKHPIYSIERLRLIDTLPRTTPLIAYQSHERLDGSGYPDGKKAEGIHDYAKIVAVADVYHAMIDPRPYRPEPMLPYKAIEALLQMSANNKLDARFVRSLLAAVSLFPVGSWVRLNTGEIARVLAANREAYTKPVVAILYGSDGKPCEPKRIDLSKSAARRVVSTLKMVTDDPWIGF